MSHAVHVHPYAGAVKVREPVPRPLDVVAAELLLSASQAFLVGVLMYLAIGIWDDRGVGFGPVAIILAGLGLAIGAAWLYWLSGGVGWPLAAGNVPTAIFLGFALVLGWQGDDLVRVEGVPLVLSLAASVYGLICGVFLDSPRRWRWDQRQKLRPGTAVPRISPTAQTFMAQVPRSIPRRSTQTPGGMPALRPEPAGSPGGQAGTLAPSQAADAGTVAQVPVTPAPPSGGAERGAGLGDATEPDAAAGIDASAAGVSAAGASAAPSAAPLMPTDRLDRAARTSGTGEAADTPAEEPATIELPTSIEPRAQRSPWAWAAPPEWTRDEDDVPPRSRSSRRS